MLCLDELVDACVQVVLMVDSTSISPQRVTVQAWTSQCDNRYADGTWHPVDLSYIGQEYASDNVVKHIYGQSVIITSDRDFEFTYRLKVHAAHGSNVHLCCKKIG